MIEPGQREFVWSYIGYQPSKEQRAAHMDPHRLKLVAGGERGGKSFSAAMELLCHVIAAPGLFWVVGPDYLQARPEFQYVHDALARLGMIRSVSMPKVGQCQLTTLFGAEVVTRSADDVRKLAGVSPDGILLCEAAQCDYEIWLKLRGRLTEKRAWLWMSGTFEGSLGWYPELWQRWQSDNPEGGRSFSIPTWANLAIFPGGRHDPEILALEQTYPEDLFLERCAAVPCPPVGLVFREFKHETHVSAAVRYDPALPVHLGIDPGYASCYYVAAVQFRDRHCYVIDEVASQGEVAEQVIARCKKRPWWPKVAGGVIDVAGKQHPGSKSQVEIWQSEAGIWLKANKVSIVDGTLRLRTYLVDPASPDGKPLIHFAPGCKTVISEFGKYRYPHDAENRAISELPIDRDNHGIKALSYLLFDTFGPVYRRKRRPTPGHNPFANRGSAQRVEIDIAPGADGGVRFVKKLPRHKTALSFEDGE